MECLFFCYICIYQLFVIIIVFSFFFFFKQKTAYEMRISDWISDVCSSDLSVPSAWMARSSADIAHFDFLLQCSFAPTLLGIMIVAHRPDGRKTFGDMFVAGAVAQERSQVVALACE